MKIIEPSVNYVEKSDACKFIEFIGRTCYKSTDLITDTSANKFVAGLIDRGHLAMIEHYWVHFVISHRTLSGVLSSFDDLAVKLGFRNRTDIIKYIQFTEAGNSVYMSMPLRVPVEWALFAKKHKKKDIPFIGHLSNPKVPVFEEVFGDFHSNEADNIIAVDEKIFLEMMMGDIRDASVYVEESAKHKTHTLLFVCDRGVSHELVRHRPCSFAQESTRYCNYSKEKFGNEITLIRPFFFGDDDVKYSVWKLACKNAEDGYFSLIALGATPQEARSVLPNSLKTEIIVTANEVEWQHIINLRYHGTTGAPHPQMKEVMNLAYPLLIRESDFIM